MPDDVTVLFASKPPHKTAWLEITYTVRPEPLLQDLADIGWIATLRPRPAADGQHTLRLAGPKGSGLFGGWTPAEKANGLRHAREVLRRHGCIGVPWRRKTWAELI